jgi:hypothetical protein
MPPNSSKNILRDQTSASSKRYAAHLATEPRRTGIFINFTDFRNGIDSYRITEL